MYILTAEEMRRMDRRTIESFGIPGRVLMENAGRGAADALLGKFGPLCREGVAVMAGRGNNGGDGFVIARCLSEKKIPVTVYLAAKADSVRGDAAANLALLAKIGVKVVEIPDHKCLTAQKIAMASHALWVDALLGTGLNTSVRGYFREIIEFINDHRAPVFAVDIPSGLSADTGQICGAAVKADLTATFAFAKRGHHLHPGSALSGAVTVVDIGIPNLITEEIAPKLALLTSEAAAGHMPGRPADAHKGTTGHLLVLAGSPGKTGAAALSSISAMRAGAGLVTLGLPAGINAAMEPMAVEVMTHPLPETAAGTLCRDSFAAIRELAEGKRCIAAGPGMGCSAEAAELVAKLVNEIDLPLVLDADALNGLAEEPEILKRRKAPAILTPHPGEMARLTGATVAEIQADRVAAASDFAERFGVHLVLKGAKSVIAHPDGRAWINPTGNPGMASGGMGDVLTGIIAALITQGGSPNGAALAGTWLHGKAADALAEKAGAIGYLASEVMGALPAEREKLASKGGQPWR